MLELFVNDMANISDLHRPKAILVSVSGPSLPSALVIALFSRSSEFQKLRHEGMKHETKFANFFGNLAWGEGELVISIVIVSILTPSMYIVFGQKDFL